MEVSMKNLLLQMESKSMRDSCMRFCSPDVEGRARQRETHTETGKRRELGVETLGCSAPRRPWAPGSSMRSVCKAYNWEHITEHLMLAWQAPTILGQRESDLGTCCGSPDEAEVRRPSIRMAEPPAI